MSTILEALANQFFKIWHVFFGTTGANNDINVLQIGPLVRIFLFREYDDISFDINSRLYSKYYLLADDLYPKWSIFVQSIKDRQGEKRKHFANKHKQP